MKDQEAVAAFFLKVSDLREKVLSDPRKHTFKDFSWWITDAAEELGEVARAVIDLDDVWCQLGDPDLKLESELRKDAATKLDAVYSELVDLAQVCLSAALQAEMLAEDERKKVVDVKGP